MMGQWFYFGCYKGVGHYLFSENMAQCYFDKQSKELIYFDGKLADQESEEPYIATIARLSSLGLTALSFWDYTIDKRGGSNCIFFAPSLTITPEEMMEECAKRFPKAWSRFPGVELK